MMNKKMCVVALFGAVVVSALFLSFMIGQPVIEKEILESRSPFLVTGDAAPGTNTTGFFYFMIYPHSATPLTTYAANLSNATAYEYSDSYNTSATRETPYGTTFDIVVKVGGEKDDVCTSSNGTWNESMCWALVTCAGLSIGADTNMTEKFIAQDGTYYCWIHYYLNNGGAGYTITEAQSFNVTGFKYYVQRLS